MSQQKRLGGTNARTDDGRVAGAAGPNELMVGCICLCSELVPFFVFALQHHLKYKEDTFELLLQVAKVLTNEKNINDQEKKRYGSNVDLLSNSALYWLKRCMTS